MQSRILYATVVTSIFLLSPQSASAQFLFGKQPPPTVCTQQYDPVCATKNGMRRTYSNACTARQTKPGSFREVHAEAVGAQDRFS